MTENKKIIVWSKNQCPYCVSAKNLLKVKNLQFEERNIESGDWSKEQLLEACPGARSVPQIVIDGEVIGGFDKLKSLLDAQS
jgi:glutaredoxin 3